MEKIEVHPKLYFYLEGKTTLNGLMEYAEPNVDKVYAEAQRAGLEKTGPLEFIYFDATADREKEFTLQIAFPVKHVKPVPAGFHFREAPSLACIKDEHHGGMDQIGKTYENLYEYIWNHSLKTNDEIREIYHAFEGPDSPNNLTEIQVGLN